MTEVSVPKFQPKPVSWKNLGFLAVAGFPNTLGLSWSIRNRQLRRRGQIVTLFSTFYQSQDSNPFHSTKISIVVCHPSTKLI